MKLREIEVKDFRKLRHARVSGLADGANVIAGENEIGKSTLLSAVQAALFQRHNVTGKVLAGMQPYGCSVRPQVRISFDLEDGAYCLQKTFGGGGSAELVCPDGRRFANQDADHKLEQLLRFQSAARGATDFSTLGIWPLFWIEQGTTFQGLNINPDVRTTVQSSLTKEVGDVLIGESGERIRRRVEQLSATFFTKTGQETSALAAARKAVTGLESKLNGAREELAAFAADVSRFETAQSRRSSLIRPELREQLEMELNEAKTIASSLAELDSQIREAVQELETTRANRSIAEMTWADRADLISLLSNLESQVTSLREASRELQAQLTKQEAETKLAEHNLRIATEALDGLREAAVSTESALAQVTLAEELAFTEAQFRKAETHAARLKELDEELGRCRIDESLLRSLRDVERSVFENRAYVDAAATRVDFAFAETGQVWLNGMPLGLRKTILAAEAVEIRVSDGTITITPGGNEIVDRKLNLERSEKHLAKMLSDLDVATVDVAAGIVEQQHRTEAQRGRVAAILGELAPSGVELLDNRVRTLRVELAAAGDRVGAIQLPSRVQAERAVAEAKLGLSRAEAAVTQARTELESRRRIEMSVRLDVATKTAELNAANREMLATGKHLVEVRTSVPDAVLSGALRSAIDAEEVCHTRLATRRQAREESDPDAVTVRMTNAVAAIDHLSEQIASVDREISGLQGRLDGLGEKGVGEACAELEADLTLARVRLRVTEQEANAIRVLNNMLQNAERDANTLFLEPVVARVQPYLNRVIRGARVELSTDLQLEGLRRDGAVEPFFALSVGVREQISVITRIAFADMLADEGIGAPIILDDALAYADDRRFADTLTTLAVAARKHQVIVLTCHEDRYIRMGCSVRRIEYVATSATA